MFERLAGDREAIAVEQTLGEEGFHHRENSANRDKLAHQISATGLEICQHGNAGTDASEIVKGELDVRGVGDREQVQNRIRPATESDGDRDGIFERFLGNDVRRADAALEHVQNGGACVAAIEVFLWRDRVLRRAVRQAETHGLDRGRHGVGGIHPSAGSRAGDGFGLDLLEFLFRDFVCGALADGLEDRDDIQLALGQAAGHDGSAINKNRRTVHPGHRHHAPRHVFVTPADRDESVEALAAHNRLDRVGNDLARDERVFHSLGAHRNAIRDGDGIENRGLAARLVDAERGLAGELVDVHVAWRDHAPGGSDADLRLGKITLLVADRIKHRAARGAAEAIENSRGKGTHGGIGFRRHG